jgi:circadian clock protein KaiB
MSPHKPVTQTPKYILRLYVSGATGRSLKALRNIKRICEERIPGEYVLRVVDICQSPEQASEDKIVVAPTLVKKLPLPVRRCVGDMADAAKVVSQLAL